MGATSPQVPTDSYPEKAAHVLPTMPQGTAAPQVYGFDGTGFDPLPFSTPTLAWPPDPYQTDLIAADFTANGQGWVAGDPAGLVADWRQPTGSTAPPEPRPGPPDGTVESSPLLTTTAAGGTSPCEGPPPSTFAYSDMPTADSYLWSSISAVPTGDDALAGGQVWPLSGDSAFASAEPNQDGAAEPVIVHAECDGSITATRFFAADPLHPGALVDADRAGTVTAIAANADNDAWAATSPGGIDRHNPSVLNAYFLPPHLYRLTDTQSPTADAALPGDDNETRPPNLQQDAPPPAEPPPPTGPGTITVIDTSSSQILAPAPVANARGTRDGPAALYDVRSKLVGRGRFVKLHLIFRLRRPVTLGAEALRHRRVVSRAALHRFSGRTGQIVLPLDTKDYPTQVRFTTDQPSVTLRNPGRRLSGTVTLRAAARPYRRRRIASVSYQYAAAAGQRLWYTIGIATAPPWAVSFPTAGLAAGRYDLRAIATDDAGVSGVSPLLSDRTIAAVTGGA